MNYSTAWFTGLSEPDRKNFKQILDSNTILLDKLKEIVYNIVKEAEVVSAVDYKNPSWSHEQAHKNGVSATGRKLLEILTGRDRDVAS